MDPLASEYAFYSPYHFAGNTPIWAIDLDGLEPLTQQQYAALAKQTASGGHFNKVTITPYCVINGKPSGYTLEFSVKYNTEKQSRPSSGMDNYPNQQVYIQVPDESITIVDNYSPMFAQLERAEALKKTNTEIQIATNPVLLSIQITADGLMTLYDVGTAAYSYANGDYTSGNISLAGALIPGLSGVWLREGIIPIVNSKTGKEILKRSQLFESLNVNSWDEFYDKTAKMSTGEQKAAYTQAWDDIVTANTTGSGTWAKDKAFTNKYGRDVYKDKTSGKYYAFDSQHGTIEVHNKNGVGESEYRFDGKYNKPNTHKLE